MKPLVRLVLVALAASLVGVIGPAPSAGAATPALPGFLDRTVAQFSGTPTALAFAPDGRLFIALKNGTVRVVENGVLRPDPVLTLSVNTSSERGLLGLAFPPDFATSHRMYVHYTTSASPHGRVSWFTLDGNTASGETPVLDLPALVAGNHNGGAIHFGADAMLYVAVGENAVPARAQDPSSPFGKILRLTPDGEVPLDNPNVSGPVDYADMVWASGLRNPFTMAFQPGTGRLFINDVGSSQFEEINEGARGFNYGWPATEGPGSPGVVHAYGRADGCSIIGGGFYNPTTVELPVSYVGDYFFSDLCGGWIRSLDTATGVVTQVATGLNSGTALIVGPDGGVYYGESGRVGRLGYTTTPPPVVGNPSRFVPVTPTRLLDTRIGLGAPAAQLGSGGQIDLQISGAGPIPATDIEAVVLNVTATEARGAGFVTVFPAGTARPNASNLNLEFAGQTAPNLVVVDVGANGRVSLFTQAGTHLVADVAGYFVASPAARDGRFVAAANPTRLLDTRVGVGAPAARLPANGQIDLTVLGAGPVPASGVSAVVLNLTGVIASSRGFVTAWPAGSGRPVASNLNLDFLETRPNLVIVPVGNGGRISLFTQPSVDLVADVIGWFTDGTADSSASGLFVPLSPTRLLDTRSAGPALGAGATIATAVHGTIVDPQSRAAAVVLNATITAATAPGFVTLWPAGQGRPVASNLNASRPQQTIANLGIVALGQGSFTSFTQSGTHLVFDVAGYFQS